MALFENYDRRIAKINGVIKEYGIGSVEECREICKAAGFDPYEIAKGIQPIRPARRTPRKPPATSASACRASASTGPWPRTARLAWGMGTWPPCC